MSVLPIRRFERLTAEDRAWILQRLSLNAKVRLAHALGAKEEDTQLYEKLHTAQVLRALEQCNASEIAHQLNGEPAWLVAAVLSASSWGWRSRVMKLLAPNLRSNVEALQRGGLTLPLPMLSRLLDILRERVDSVNSPSISEKPLPDFEQLVATQKESLAC